MVMSRTFSTERLPHAERTRAWIENIRGSLYEASIHPFSEAGIEGESYARMSEDFTVIAFKSNEHTVQRTPELIRSNPKHTLFISTVLSGSATLYRPGLVHTANSGDTLVYSPDEPYMIAFQPGTSQLFTEVSLDGLASRFGSWKYESARKVDIRGSRLGATQTGSVQALASDIASASTSNASIFKRVEALLSAVGKLAFPSGSSAIVAEAKAFIEEHAADSELSCSDVAQHMHLSLRQLNRLFACEGSTVAKHLAQKRTRNAEHLLAEGSYTLNDVAAMSGFGSVSTLYRHVRRR